MAEGDRFHFSEYALLLDPRSGSIIALGALPTQFPASWRTSSEIVEISNGEARTKSGSVYSLGRRLGDDEPLPAPFRARLADENLTRVPKSIEGAGLEPFLVAGRTLQAMLDARDAHNAAKIAVNVALKSNPAPWTGAAAHANATVHPDNLAVIRGLTAAFMDKANSADNDPNESARRGDAWRHASRIVIAIGADGSLDKPLHRRDVLNACSEAIDAQAMKSDLVLARMLRDASRYARVLASAPPEFQPSAGPAP